MNCANHPEVTAAAYCRTCGKALCENCERTVHGVIYCEDCLASRVHGTPAPAAPPPAPSGRHSVPSPTVAGVLAFFLPFGVAQAYLGQYARGVAHLFIFIALVWGTHHAGSADFIFGLGIAAFYFYQIIDSVRSARFLAAGQPAPDPFGLDNLFGRRPGQPTPSFAPAAGFAPQQPGVTPQGTAGFPAPTASQTSEETHSSSAPSAAIILVALGVLFFLNSSGLFHWYWTGSIWPLIFVVIGAVLLVKNWEAITTRHASLMAPAVMLTLGVLFLAQSMGRMPFSRSFPLLLIVIGLVLFWQRSAPQPPQPPPPGVSGSGANGGEATQFGSGDSVKTTGESEPER